MPNCKNCGAEVDLDQKTCAWCGVENPAGGAAPPPAKQPAQAKPSSGSELRVQKGQGPSVEDARRLAQMGDMTGALSLFNRILESHPNHEEALFGIGGVHFKNGDPKKAMEYWLKLKVINPHYPNLENWIEQAKQKVPRPAPHPPSPAAHTPPPPPPPRHAPAPAGVMEPEEDWQRQSVRVSEREQQEALQPPPKPKPKEVPAIEEILDEDDERVRPKPWVVPTSWGLLVLYALLIWVLYFSPFLIG